MIPVSVREKSKQFNFTIGTGVKTRDIVIFTRQFATMINSGLPLVQSLDILAEQTENPSSCERPSRTCCTTSSPGTPWPTPWASTRRSSRTCS